MGDVNVGFTSNSSGNVVGTWLSWTPTWTNVTIGDATVVGSYVQIGKLVQFNLSVTLGSTSSVSGAIIYSLPVNNSTTSYPASAVRNIIGSGSAQITNAFSIFSSIDSTSGANKARILSASTTSAGQLAATSGTVPGSWTNGSTLQVSGFYEAS